MSKTFMITLYVLITFVLGRYQVTHALAGVMFLTPFIVSVLSKMKIAKELKAKELLESNPPLKEVKS